MTCLIGIDPGKDKCGLVLVDVNNLCVLDGQVVLSKQMINLIIKWQKSSHIDQIILGNGTTSKYWEPLLSEFAFVNVIDEQGTSLKARKRYWELWPPSKLIAILPRGLILPRDNLDAVAALILVEDYLGQKLSWTGSYEFRI
tara:strand:- start:109 stop:534 length:426 start_codon:yes stop_codon:yes gene_type:complete